MYHLLREDRGAADDWHGQFISRWPIGEYAFKVLEPYNHTPA